ncbi:MAG: hypothetical protein V4757_19460 [Pseudomonadota bacterium]
MTEKPMTSGARRRRQRGLSLLIVTLLIMAIALMTLSVFYMSRNQFQLAANIQQSELAFGQAESGIVTAEAWLGSGTNARQPGFDAWDKLTPHLYPIGRFAALGTRPQSMAWSDSNSLAVSSDTRYLIEQLARGARMTGESIAVSQSSSSCKSVDLFRVVAQARAGNGGLRLIETMQATAGC